MYEGWVTSSVQFPNYQPKKLPGFDVLWVEITLKMRGEKSPLLIGEKEKYSLLVQNTWCATSTWTVGANTGMTF